MLSVPCAHTILSGHKAHKLRSACWHVGPCSCSCCMGVSAQRLGQQP